MSRLTVLILLGCTLILGMIPVQVLRGQTRPPDAPPSSGPPSIPVMDVPRPPGGRHFPGEPPMPEARSRKKAFDAASARKQADELSDLAQKVPEQLDQVSKDMLPKDLIRNLKRIEKLAKRLRKQVER